MMFVRGRFRNRQGMCLLALLTLVGSLAGCAPTIPDAQGAAAIQSGQGTDVEAKVDTHSNISVLDAMEMAPTLSFSGQETVTTDKQPVRYNIIIDGSASMKGFVAKGCTEYAAMLDSLNAVCFGEEVSYYKFGGKVTANEKKSFMNNAALSGFYTGTSTNIANVFKWIKKNEKVPKGKQKSPVVNILISEMACTDAFQYVDIAETLLSQYIEPRGKSVCLIGLQVKFSGTIYDIPVKGKLVNYRLNKASFRRPVYMLLFGDKDGVAQLCSEIAKSVGEKEISEPQFFALETLVQHIVSPKATLQWSDDMQFYTKEEDPEYVFGTAGIQKEQSWIKGIQSYRAYVGLNIKDEITGESLVKQPINDAGGTISFRIPYSYTTDEQPGSVATMQWLPWETGDITVAAQQLTAGGDAEPATMLTLGQVRLEKNGSDVYAVIPYTINYAAMTLDQPVLFDISAKVTPRFVALPKLTDETQWLADWTMDLNILETQSAREFNQQAKTPYIKDMFLDRIWGKFSQEQQTVVTQYAKPMDCGRVTFTFALRDKGKEPWSISEEEIRTYKGESE